MNNLRVISGGQSGSDQGGLRAAKAAGIPTGGAMPLGFLTEDGPAPHLKEEFGLVELETTDYPSRTRWNVECADACIWFGNPHSPGGKLTLRSCQESAIRAFVVISKSTPKDVVTWLRDYVFPGSDSVTLMVAGNRESSSLGIGEKTETFLRDVFTLLKETT